LLHEWHLITSEYPPQVGGVSDYTQMIAAGLAAAGDEVHVWCPPAGDAASNGAESETANAERGTTNSAGVFVHRELGSFTRGDLRRAGRLMDEFGAPRRLLVQWVPHGYGLKSMNLPFCWWLRRRALRRRSDVVEVMVHEPYLAFGEGSWKQSGVAAVHRLMTVVLLSAVRRVWMSIPAWETSLRPYALGRKLPFRWLPVASNIPVVDDPAGVRVVRERYAPAGEQIVGHFGTYDRHITELLLKIVPLLLRDRAACVMLLMGRGSVAMREGLISRFPDLAERLHATGTLAAAKLSLQLSACDVMLQPFIDGVSSRRTSVMVGLSHGMPIVTTSGRLTEPLWQESEAVSLSPVEDITALVKAAERLLSDATLRRRMSAAARSLYCERFDVKRIISALREASV
jgi:glycosyltransferase involved in cell wall biosynthesis